LFWLSCSPEDSAQWANPRRRFRWLSLVLRIMAPAIDPATITARGTMLRDITGDPADIVTTGDLIGGTDTGGITAGIGIERVELSGVEHGSGGPKGQESLAQGLMGPVPREGAQSRRARYDRAQT
jgi:hypothetical protein